MSRRHWILVGACLALAACGGRERVQIGSKDFTESRILAEMMALVAEDAGIPVERVIPYGSSRVCLEATQQDVIDAYPEYSGTLLSLAGRPPLADADEAARQASNLMRPVGLAWLERFGLSNNFAIVVRRDLALRDGYSEISDLANADRPLRMAVDESFERRMSDGFAALVRRYGLQVGQVFPFSADRRADELRLLLEGDVDAAVLYGTDFLIGEFGLTVLEDDLDFFPAYQPAPLVRQDTLERFPALGPALESLADTIDTVTMRELIAKVEGGGKDYRDVAEAHLQRLGLLPGEPVESPDRSVVTVAVGPFADQGGLAVRAARGLREVMPARPLRVVVEPSPAKAVLAGRARFGLLSAEEFLVETETGWRMGETLEAVGVVGTRVAHLIAPVDRPIKKDFSSLRLGVGTEGDSSERVARLMTAILGLEDRVELVRSAAPQELLADREVDALLVTAELGHVAVAKWLADGEYRLISVEDAGASRRLQYPLLRPARIPAFTYPNQTQAIETLASQVVLATVVPPKTDTLGNTGHSLIPGLGRDLPQRLPPRTAARIQETLGPVEAVDPLLPVSPGLLPVPRPVRIRVAGNPVSTLLNVIAVAFLLAMVMFYFAPVPKQPALEAAEPDDERDTN